MCLFGSESAPPCLDPLIGLGDATRKSSRCCYESKRKKTIAHAPHSPFTNIIEGKAKAA